MTRLTLWNPDVRPAYTIYDWDGNLLESGFLGAEEVCCDLCNEEIFLRPVPVVSGYALCNQCLTKVVPDWFRQIYRRPDGADVLEAWYKQLEYQLRKASD